MKRKEEIEAIEKKGRNRKMVGREADEAGGSRRSHKLGNVHMMNILHPPYLNLILFCF